MTKFLTGLIVAVLTNEEVQKVIKNLLSQLITEKIAPLVPLAAASAAKAVAEAIPGVDNIQEALGDVVGVAEKTRQELNTLIPDIDIGIPVIDSILDAWRPR